MPLTTVISRSSSRSGDAVIALANGIEHDLRDISALLEGAIDKLGEMAHETSGLSGINGFVRQMSARLQAEVPKIDEEIRAVHTRFGLTPPLNPVVVSVDMGKAAEVREAREVQGAVESISASPVPSGPLPGFDP